MNYANGGLMIVCTHNWKYDSKGVVRYKDWSNNAPCHSINPSAQEVVQIIKWKTCTVCGAIEYE